jgi:glycosyltransferase involved in cell wall biosynthesis
MDRQQTDAVTDRPVVSIAIATYNRLAFLEQAVEAVLQNADLPFELIIWNNASGEDTRQWLDSLEDDRIRVIHSDKNAGCSAYELAFRQSRGDWLVTMDDDVLRLPENFLSKMRAALQACPDLGYVALDVVRDDKTNGSKPEEYAYKDEWHDGICLQFGPAGGWCAMTPPAPVRAGTLPGERRRSLLHLRRRLCQRNHGAQLPLRHIEGRALLSRHWSVVEPTVPEVLGVAMQKSPPRGATHEAVYGAWCFHQGYDPPLVSAKVPRRLQTLAACTGGTTAPKPR